VVWIVLGLSSSLGWSSSLGCWCLLGKCSLGWFTRPSSWLLGWLYGLLGLFDPVGAVDLGQFGTDHLLHCPP